MYDTERRIKKGRRPLPTAIFPSIFKNHGTGSRKR